jgi:hypothetical protein
MKFKEVLTEKNLTVENLPSSIKKKIESLESLEEKIRNIEKSGIGDDEVEIYQQAQKRLNDLDKELEKAILKFNPEVYQKRLEHIKKVHTNRKENKEEVIENKQEEVIVENEQVAEIVEAEIIPELQVQEEIEDSLEPNSNEEQENFRTIEIPKIEKREDSVNVEEIEYERIEKNKIRQELRELKNSIKDISNNTVPEELKVHGKAEPKKKTMGLVLMGAGVFLLTWGAVNFFKDR